MPEKGSFLFRTNPKMLAALKRWADDEFRSINGQLEYILHQALRESGRLSDAASDPASDAGRKSRKNKPVSGR